MGEEFLVIFEDGFIAAETGAPERFKDDVLAGAATVIKRVDGLYKRMHFRTENHSAEWVLV